MNAGKAAKFFTVNSQRIMGIGLGGLFMVGIVPQTWGLNLYKRMMSQYKDDKEEDVAPLVQKLVDNVLYDIKLRPEDEARIGVFVNSTNNLVHKGSIKLRTGAIIGIPGTFKHTSRSTLGNETMQVNIKSIDWYSPAGNSLLDSLILSEDAKKFAIAREIYYVTSNHVLGEALLKWSFAFMAYTTGFMLYRKFQLKDRLKVWGRGILYGVIASFYVMMYLMISDAYACSLDNWADKKAADLGQDYCLGGLEFYKNSLKQNIAIRYLMGTEGRAYYTPHGNVMRSVFRRPSVEITARKDHLERLLKEYDDSKRVVVLENV